MDNIEQAREYARCFSCTSGQKVLEQLQSMTLKRVLGPEAQDSMLWYLEGQRQLVNFILSMIERGINTQQQTILEGEQNDR